MTKKQFLLNSLSNCELTSTQIIDKWIFENQDEFSKRVYKYINEGKEKIGETKFTKNQIRSELIGIFGRYPKIFTSKVITQNIETENANFRILADRVYFLK